MARKRKLWQAPTLSAYHDIYFVAGSESDFFSRMLITFSSAFLAWRGNEAVRMVDENTKRRSVKEIEQQCILGVPLCMYTAREENSATAKEDCHKELTLRCIFA